MRLGIIGLPYVGKTSIFNSLTRGHATVGEFGHEVPENVGVVNVPDPRLDYLHTLHPKAKKVHGNLEIADFPGLVKGDSTEKSKIGLISRLREVDAFIHVVRMFDDPTVAHVHGTVDPVRDIEDLRMEFLIGDLEQTENRIYRVEKQMRHGKTRDAEIEYNLLTRIKADLENETPVRDIDMTEDENKVIRGFQMLSQKPMLYALNVNEGASERDDAAVWSAIEPLVTGPSLAAVGISAKLENDLAELDADEAEAFLREMGMEESGTAHLLRVCRELLGIITFFTIGDDEVRAWHIQAGTEAKRAAGVIHSDLEKGFIRAEIIHVDVLREVGSLEEAKKRGLIRLEKKDYIIADGEINHVRFS